MLLELVGGLIFVARIAAHGRAFEKSAIDFADTARGWFVMGLFYGDRFLLGGFLGEETCEERTKQGFELVPKEIPRKETLAQIQVSAFSGCQGTVPATQCPTNDEYGK